MNSKRSLDWAAQITFVLFAVLFCQSVARGQTQAADDILSDQHGTAWGRTPYNRHTWDVSTGPLPTPGNIMPHAGDYVSTEWNYYEVVYMPLQTRIYLYDKKFLPVSAKDVHAQMTVQFPAEATARKVPFQFVPQPPGATEQDFVAVNLDITPLQGKTVDVGLQFSDLVKGGNSTEVFTPHYAHFAIRPYLAKAMLTAADNDAIARQRTCPVSGVPLGSRGRVVKLYVAEFPIYLAGEDCVAAVKAAPQKFVPQAPPEPNLAR
jgi:hypothetical protein